MSKVSVNDVDFGEHGVIYVTSDKDRPMASEWTRPATAELLKLLKVQYKMFYKGKLPSKRKVYDNCADHMTQTGYMYSSAQCENKWKSLKRKYMANYERIISGKQLKSKFFKPMFNDEVAEILRIETPSFKKELDAVTKVNLNIPPGFLKKEEITLIEDEEDLLDDYDQEYTKSDAKLVEMVLQGKPSMDQDNQEDEKDDKSNVFSNIEYLFTTEEDQAMDSDQKISNFDVLGNIKNSNMLVQEIQELRKVVNKNLNANVVILKSHNATHEQLLFCLDTLDKREEEKMEMRRRKLEKKSELIQQIKIQNSLIAKLIQKLGN